MENLIHRALALDLKMAAPEGVISGLASSWDTEPDLHGDVIRRGAFQKSLESYHPAMLWSHDQSAPIGKWLEIEETDSGLEVTGRLTLSVTKAADALHLASDGCLGLSIGFKPIRQETKDGVNVISEVFLGEISLVAMPSNRNAVITNVKSFSQINNIIEYQNFLHGMGLSVRESKALARKGWGGFRGDEAELAEAAEFIRASTFRIRGI